MSGEFPFVRQDKDSAGREDSRTGAGTGSTDIMRMSRRYTQYFKEVHQSNG